MASCIQEEVNVWEILVGQALVLLRFEDSVDFTVALVVESSDFLCDFRAFELVCFKEKLLVLVLLHLYELFHHGLAVRMELNVVSWICRAVKILVYFAVFLSSFSRYVD